MKNVYVIIESGCAQEGFSIVGIFSSKSKAKKILEEIQKQHYYYDYIKIVKFEVNSLLKYYEVE